MGVDNFISLSADDTLLHCSNVVAARTLIKRTILWTLLFAMVVGYERKRS